MTKCHGPTPPVELTKYGRLLSQGAEARVWLITLPSSSSNVDNTDDTTTIGKKQKTLHVGAGLHVPQLGSFVHPSSLLLLGKGRQLQHHPPLQVICKERFTKKYRHPQLDATLTKSRTKSEARSLLRCQKAGISCPNVLAIANWSTNTNTTTASTNKANECLVTSSTTASSSSSSSCLYLEYIKGCTVREYFEQQSCERDGRIKTTIDTQTLYVAYTIGTLVNKMHSEGIIHGDLTTSNIMLGNPPMRSEDDGKTSYYNSDKQENGMNEYEESNNSWKPQLLLIDFGLATNTNNSTSNNQHKQQNNAEEKAVDLYVLERAFLSTHPESEMLVEEVWKGYCSYHEKKLDCDLQTDDDNGAVVASSADANIANAVMNRLEQVRMRGRKRECFG